MRKSFKKLIAMVSSLAMLASFCLVPMSASAAEDTRLKFDSEGKFKIVIFSDVQDQYPVNQRVIRIMEQAIEREDPDFIVFTGDMTEINTKDVNVDYRKTVEQILGPVVHAGLPYSIVFGNHDPQSYYSGQVTSKDAMLEVWQSIGDCRTVDANLELSGTGTCKIPVYSSNGSAVAFNLWMLDSGSYQNPLDGKSGYGSVQDDQLAWMANNNDAGVKSIAFQHIPMPQMYNLFVEDANGEKTYNGKTYKKELIAGVTGKAGEFPAPCPADKSNEYASLKAMGNVLGVVTGHDHLNDFTGKFEEDGVEMTAVPGMTYFNYGDEAIRGYGVIELDEANLSKYDYHSVKFSTIDAEAGGTTETVYDEYDEITYSDLKQNGNALGENYTINGGHTFTYDATSTSKSAILKFRWTAGKKPGFQFSFDVGDEGNIAHPFGVWIKRADQVAPNGAWHLKPNKSDLEVKMDTAVKQGDTFDIELGRLKVLEGDPKIVGQYYVYLKVNGKLVQEGYSNTAEDGGYSSGNKHDCMVSNQIRFGGWGNGGDDIISEYVEPVITEEYAAYDVIGYEDLLDTGNNPLTPGGIQLTKTDNSVSYVESEEAAKTHSVIFKLRWTMETKDYFQIHMQSWGGANNFAYIMDGAYFKDRATDAAVPVSPRATTDDYYDFEVGRLMVVSGVNAGKYYSYFKVDGEIIFEKYVSATDENTTKYLGNKIYIGFEDNNTCKISATPYDPNPDALYYAYDEITFDDLFVNGQSMAGSVMHGAHTYTYNATSATYSVKLNFRWIAGTDPKFSLLFDSWDDYAFFFAVKRPNESGFGATAGENGAYHLVPSNNSTIVQMDEPIVAGKAYDMEVGRLKVKNGEHAGKYYVYWMVDGKLIQSYYYDGVVDGVYGKNNVALSNQFTIQPADATSKFTAVPFVEKYEAYDDLSFNDLWINENSMVGREMDGGHNYTYNATSPSYSMKLKFRWTAGGEELQFSTFLDDWKYPFCFAAKVPNRADWGAAAGPNGAWHLVPSNPDLIVQMDEPIVAGQSYDIEIGRLKVANGANAGKYYVYFMVDGEMIVSYYYDGVVDGVYEGVALSNKIIFSAKAGNTFKATPFVEEYEDYDEIGFEDLKDAEGNSLSGQKQMSGHTVFNYDSTSATGSVVFKYRWKIGSVAKFQMSFEKAADNAMGYMFGAWMYAPSEVAAEGYPNGRVWLRPSYGPQAQLAEALGSGTSHNVEFGRLMVANGSNKGKYYVYFKIDDVLIAESYVDANVVDANGNYVTGPGEATCNVKSGEIFMAFWGTEGNVITSYKVPGSTVHEGTKGDFNGDGFIAAEDLVTLRKIILGLVSTIEMPSGIADFNLDGKVDVRDLVAMKKYMAPVNSYEKTGSLALGMQEHLLADESKTPTYIADVTATIGASTFRLSRPIHTLYYVTENNGVAVKEENMAQFRAMVEALIAKGITEILYVSDAFILPYGYADAAMNHNKTVPDPVTDYENYIAWLNVNAAAFKALAEEFPEIKYFEPYNEMNVSKGSGLERYGIAWDAEENDAYKYTMEERAGITADLCWYISKAVKSVDRANQVTTPSLSVDTNYSHVEGDFLDALYKAIESGSYPRYNDVADTRVDNYFTIINIHAYVEYHDTNSKAQERVNDWADRIAYAYNIAKAHNDGGSRVWLTETGMSTYHPDGEPRNEDKVANFITMSLNKLNTELTFVDTVIFYEIADMSTDAGASAVETNYGLFYAGDDGWAPYAAKPSAKAVYSFFNGGTNDYSALNALTNRYAQ